MCSLGAAKVSALSISTDALQQQCPNGACLLATNFVPGVNTVLFDWEPQDSQGDGSGTPYQGFANFTADMAFNVILDTYSPSVATADVSGFTLDVLDGAAGTAISRLTTNTTFCLGASLAEVSAFGGACNLVTGAANTGGNANLAAKPGESLFTSLSAGSYRLGFYESSTPNDGLARFQFTAVPVPATVLLFGLGLALLGWTRRLSAI